MILNANLANDTCVKVNQISWNLIPVYPISVYYQGFSPIQRILKSPKIDQAIFPHFYKLKENGINHLSKLVSI